MKKLPAPDAIIAVTEVSTRCVVVGFGMVQQMNSMAFLGVVMISRKEATLLQDWAGMWSRAARRPPRTVNCKAF